MHVLVTGGSGFIGSALIRYLLGTTDATVANVDALTYAAVPGALAAVEDDPRYCFYKVDICDSPTLADVIAGESPDLIMHLAAESHVDRSIDSPSAFMQTNIMGTYSLLECALRHWQGLEGARRSRFRLHHISTDEVYGSLGDDGLFTETTPYRPSSPYSASKAASDHLVRAWYHTYGLPTLVSNCSNNYGPFQFPEKLIPLMVINCLTEKPLPVYGRGVNVRDWLYVDDHAAALWAIANKGRAGETYNVGGASERRNLEVVETICDTVDRLVPGEKGAKRRDLVRFVDDRPGHDHRYAIDFGKVRAELGWSPRETFESGLLKTVQWYSDNRPWWREILESRYDGGRLGQGGDRPARAVAT